MRDGRLRLGGEERLTEDRSAASMREGRVCCRFDRDGRRASMVRAEVKKVSASFLHQSSSLPLLPSGVSSRSARGDQCTGGQLVSDGERRRARGACSTLGDSGRRIVEIPGPPRRAAAPPARLPRRQAKPLANEIRSAPSRRQRARSRHLCTNQGQVDQMACRESRPEVMFWTQSIASNDL